MSGSSGIIVGSPSPFQGSPGTNPPEGPKSLPLTLPFTSSNTTFTLYSYALLQQGAMTQLQSVFINNSTNSQAVNVTVSGTGNSFSVPAGAQQWCALLAPSNSQITFSSTGAVTVTGQITNFWVTPTSAGGEASGGTYIGGALSVTDQTLDATVSNGKVQTSTSATGSGDVTVADYKGTISYTNTPNSGFNYVQMTTGAPYFCLTGVIFSVTGDIAFSGGAQAVNLSLYDGSNQMLQATFWAGSEPAGTGTTVVLALSGLSLLTTTSGGAINFVLTTESGGGAVATTGHAYCTIFGAKTAG